MRFVYIMITAMLLMACAASNKSGNYYDTAKSEDSRLYLNLMDYLRGQPGVQFHGDHVTIRGTRSFNADEEPLYVINGSIIGNSYQQANSVIDPNDIASVRILKDVTSTSNYGMRGANGVILIKTKPAKEKKAEDSGDN